MTPRSFSGGCLCGAVRYTSAAPAVFMANCHCRDCQRSTGSAYSPVIAAAAAAVTLEGELNWHQVTSDSGHAVRRGSCAKCGSTLIGVLGKNPTLYALLAGTLDDPSWYRPAFNMWVRRKSAWSLIDPDLPVFEGQAPESNPVYDGFRKDERR